MNTLDQMEKDIKRVISTRSLILKYDAIYKKLSDMRKDEKHKEFFETLDKVDSVLHPNRTMLWKDE